MKFRKKPVVIEAIQWDGTNEYVLSNFMGELDVKYPEYQITIHTLEGDMVADKDDWIIKGIKGEFYPCKPNIFEQTYEPVE